MCCVAHGECVKRVLVCVGVEHGECVKGVLVCGRALQPTYINLCLLRSEVPLHAGVHICVEGHFDDPLLDGRHVGHLLSVVTRHRRATQPRRLQVRRQPIKEEHLDVSF